MTCKMVMTDYFLLHVVVVRDACGVTRMMMLATMETSTPMNEIAGCWTKQLQAIIAGPQRQHKERAASSSYLSSLPPCQSRSPLSP